MRSFTIEKITKTNGNQVRYNEGRFISKTPAGAVKKSFAKAYHYLNASGALSLKITIRETTQGSLHKSYSYRVTRKAEKKTVVRDGETITYNFTTSIKSI